MNYRNAATVSTVSAVSTVSTVSTLSCRCCQHYQVEGRRGGNCQALNVPVRGNWQACPLAIRSFVSDSPVEDITNESNLSVNREKILPLKPYELVETSPRIKVS